MKRVLLLSLCVLVLFGIVGCREKRSASFENDISEGIIDNSTEFQISAEELERTEITGKSAIDDENQTGENEYSGRRCDRTFVKWEYHFENSNCEIVSESECGEKAFMIL